MQTAETKVALTLLVPFCLSVKCSFGCFSSEKRCAEVALKCKASIIAVTLPKAQLIFDELSEF